MLGDMYEYNFVLFFILYCVLTKDKFSKNDVINIGNYLCIHKNQKVDILVYGIIYRQKYLYSILSLHLGRLIKDIVCCI